MKVAATEKGSRPSTLTKARVIAPQAAKFLAEQLQDKDFADSAIIMVDWDGDFNWKGDGPMPSDLRVPAMLVFAEKWYPQWSARLIVDYRLDLEDFFGQDNATSDDLHMVVQGLEDKFREQESLRRSR